MIQYISMKKLPIYLLVAATFISVNALKPLIAQAGAPSADHLDFTTQVDCGGNCTSGVVLPAFTVSVENDLNVVDTLYGGDVTLSLFVGSGSLSGTTTVTAVNGVATFNNVVYHAGYDIEGVSFIASATDGPNPGETGIAGSGASQTFTSDVVATRFVVTFPYNSEPGSGEDAEMDILATDADGTVADIDYSPTGKTFTLLDSLGAPLTSHIAPDGAAPNVPSSSDFENNFNYGLTKPNITFTKAESLGTLTFSDGTLSGTTDSLTVGSGPVGAFEVTTSTDHPRIHVPFDLTVTVLDSHHNVYSGKPYTGTIDVETTARAPYVLAPSVYTFKSEDHNTKTFERAITLNSAENGVVISVNQISNNNAN